MTAFFPSETLQQLVPEEVRQVRPLTAVEMLEVKSFCDGYERQVFARVAPLTTDLATRLIRAGYIPNRVLDWNLVKEYAGAITRGEWRLNGESIKITPDGYMINGRHRCCAVLLAEKTIETLFVIGVDRETFVTIDIGKVRSIATHLHIMGESRPRVLAAALVWQWRLSEDYMMKKRGEVHPTPREILSLLEKHSTLRISVDASRTYKGLLPESVIAFLHYQFKQRSEALAIEFLGKLKTGLGLSTRYDPLYLLREKLELIRHNHLHRIQHDDLVEMMAYTIQAWNYVRKDEPIRTLGKWDALGFPAIL